MSLSRWNCSADSLETSRSDSRSCLFPTKNIITSGQHYSRTSASQVYKFSNVSRRFMEQQRNTAWAARQKILVIERNDSWPAVSQIYNLRKESSTLMQQEPKSTPTVTLCSVSNLSFVRRVRMHDLPTPIYKQMSPQTGHSTCMMKLKQLDKYQKTKHIYRIFCHSKCLKPSAGQLMEITEHSLTGISKNNDFQQFLGRQLLFSIQREPLDS